VVPRRTVSSAHAKVTATKGGIQIKDLGSTNGTFVDGKKVGSATLKAGQTVVFGDKTFSVVEVAGASGSTKVGKVSDCSLSGLNVLKENQVIYKVDRVFPNVDRMFPIVD
jgi:pSer/pThr/pTyr-binding forkhead associated (FHA) protein